MSQICIEKVNCCFCQKEFEITFYSSINVGIDPQLKEKVLDYSVFKHRCPHCQKIVTICDGLVYHDPIKELLFVVNWIGENHVEKMDNNTKTILKTQGMKNYRYRSVYGYNELKEKIAIFDYDLDDRVIEIQKSYLIEQYKDEFDIEEIYFWGIENKQLIYQLKAKSSDYTIKFDYEKYVELNEYVKPFFVEKLDYMRIDQNYVSEFLEKMKLS